MVKPSKYSRDLGPGAQDDLGRGPPGQFLRFENLGRLPVLGGVHDGEVAAGCDRIPEPMHAAGRIGGIGDEMQTPSISTAIGSRKSSSCWACGSFRIVSGSAMSACMIAACGLSCRIAWLCATATGSIST